MQNNVEVSVKKGTAAKTRFGEFSSTLAIIIQKCQALKSAIIKDPEFHEIPCTRVSSDFDETWSADRGWSKIITEVDLAAQNTL